MVSGQIDKRKTIKPRKIPDKVLVPLLYFLIIGTFVLICFLMKYHDRIGSWLVKTEVVSVAEEYSVTEDGSATEEEAEESTQVRGINFQNIIDEWVKTANGRKSVLIYDLEKEQNVGAYNVDADYNMASLYKLFVAYEGYLRLQSGEWNAEAVVESTGHNILECLDLMIRESNSPCAESLWAKIGYAELDQITTDKFNILNSSISDLVSNASDIVAMMRIYYKHEGVTDEKLLSQIKDSLLNQPATTYDWGQGLPSGFSKARVYDKVGWDYNSDEEYWNFYHDAAIVEFPEGNRHFIVVVMTSEVDYEQIKDLGTRIENYYYNN